MEIQTREFRIGDYDLAIELWNRVEGLDVAEGDDRETIQRFLERNPGLSRAVLGLKSGSKNSGAVSCMPPNRLHASYRGGPPSDGTGRGVGAFSFVLFFTNR